MHSDIERRYLAIIDPDALVDNATDDDDEEEDLSQEMQRIRREAIASGDKKLLKLVNTAIKYDICHSQLWSYYYAKSKV